MTRIIVVACALLVLGLGVGFAVREGRKTPARNAALAAPAGLLGVEELMQKPEDHPGRVRVQGVVSDVQPDNHLVVLIDRKEWEECGEVGCASLSLPVRWAGTMPHVEEGVSVSGQVEEQAGKLVFVAEALERVSAPREGTR